jgi:hypothetical protein
MAMKEATKAAFFVVGTVAQFGLSSPASAQYINSTAFCRSIDGQKCAGAFLEGQQASMRDLRRVDGSLAVYFFADINAPSRMPFVFNMVRQGSCYTDNFKNSAPKMGENPGKLESLKAWATSGRAVDAIFQALNIGRTQAEVGVGIHVGVAAVDAKVTPVIVPGANNYSINDYRYVLCAGTFFANIMDVDGNVIAGTNPVRKISISE